ncbi:MAG TPA: protein kinase [Candidatus Polarisedimenticolia bacterium]|nr:protein kinase [Candidatus Polarisedimenticolia bacterium]
MSDAPPEPVDAPGQGENGSGGAEAMPERIGPYRVLDLLGAGGMGRVHRALDEALDREVALKTLLPALAADREFVARFTREARSAASLNHPNITQIYATGQEGAIPWFSMELIRGQSLEALARDHGAIDPYEAASYIRQGAMGLRHAAQKGLIHRDIKPSNLMLTTEGVVKITDFGLAKAAQADTRLTATGEVLGSPGYISPEQAQGHEIDHRSDIYSLGASFYHLVTGRLPFQAPTAVAMILKHMNEPLKSPRAINADIPFPIASIVQKMMAKRPGERFQDYDALLRDLDRALSETRAMPARDADGATRDPAGATARRRAPSAAAAETWDVRTGMVGAPVSARPPSASRNPASPRGARPAASVEPVPEKSSLSILPIAMMIAVASLVGGGVWRKLTEAPAAAPAATGPQLESEGSFTTRPHAAAIGGEREGGLGPHGSRASLVFLSNDHDTLPNGGGLKVTGRVQNAGAGEAKLSRVRVRVLLDNGSVAAQAETALQPATLAPGQIASFEVHLDYDGPVGTLRAELIWND